MYKAKFRTAYLQREIPVDAVVVASNPMKLGAVAKVTFYEPHVAVVEAITAKDAKDVDAVKTAMTHIIAQSDMTLEYGHVPVENRDYKYSDEVAASVDALANFDGFFESEHALSTSKNNGANGHCALVKKSEGEYYKYTSDGTKYSNSKAVVKLKKVALFAIADKSDVIVYNGK